MYFLGRTESAKYIVPKNMTKAFEFASKACELKNMIACEDVSEMYARGYGTKMDEKKAEEFKKKAKDLRENMKKQF
jgi:TPR repeat protein